MLVGCGMKDDIRVDLLHDAPHELFVPDVGQPVHVVVQQRQAFQIHLQVIKGELVVVDAEDLASFQRMHLAHDL
ncbi:hypothetical protein SRABI128_04280 [Microbacterium sp. Bi128]|nr:hypothetical protein SRABI128_04280 [Microbacterium sp. Bi128]